MTGPGIRLVNPSEFPEGFQVDEVFLDQGALMWRWREHSGVCWPPIKGLSFFILWPPGQVPSNRDVEDLIESMTHCA